MSYDRRLADIAREFPAWTIWRSDAGRWWATRHHPLTVVERDAGCAMTIDADDPDGLRRQLTDQLQRAATADDPHDRDPLYHRELLYGREPLYDRDDLNGPDGPTPSA
ncbi:hypothetical protein SAMN05421505_1329 [Sinosporangium album]|uniref:Uncharacterized protein n=1 Tax=Sinosporangium album TaxID=504805 RepID=A0A1G8HFC7_9ACTN|nr:hypothetical protein [Sinosporangium album]SDI05387.1 hypothetical protein SAMN05421505_1329 [Sinosporangium album]